ncbi:MAG TPA: hypothetical protein PLX59_05430 [Candidatus Cloacimonadota bacterium]|nr:hypothetical protein [Candidatus Cloacimonadota bacterium]
MDQQQINQLASDLAAVVNRLVNLPYVSEAEEQALFELILRKALKLVLRDKSKPETEA